MEDLNPQVTKAFKILPKTIIKSKLTYICKTSNGIYDIRPTAAKTENIELAHIIKENLYKNDFKYIDTFCIAEDEKPYVKFGDLTYTMTRHIDYNETSFELSNNMKKITSQVANMHNAIIKADIDLKINSTAENKDMLDSWDKKIHNLKKNKKNVLNKKRLSDFDLIFLKNFDTFYEQAAEAYARLDAIYDKIKNPKSSFCHNILKEETLLTEKNKVYIVNFNEVSKRHFLNDVCSIINRYIRKHNEQYIDIKEILDIYGSVVPIDSEDIKFLYALLKFPCKFIDICESFYMKNRTWTPNSISNNLISTINLNPHYTKYISGLLEL